MQQATEQLRKLEESQRGFRAQLEKKLEEAFEEVDKDERGYLKPERLDTLLKTAFTTFKPHRSPMAYPLAPLLPNRIPL